MRQMFVQFCSSSSSILACGSTGTSWLILYESFEAVLEVLQDRELRSFSSAQKRDYRDAVSLLKAFGTGLGLVRKEVEWLLIEFLTKRLEFGEECMTPLTDPPQEKIINFLRCSSIIQSIPSRFNAMLKYKIHLKSQQIYLTNKLLIMQQSSLEESKNTGRWTKEEHQRFMYAIMQYGKDWKKVENYVKTRSGSQVRSHAQKFFSKMQKNQPGSGNNDRSRKQTQEYSQTEFDVQRELNNEQTPSTPMQLVSLIRKQSKEEGGKIKLSELKKTLDQQQELTQKPKNEGSSIEQEILTRVNSFKSMSNILSAYEEINNKADDPQDESFFISITKKYKRMFRQVEDFDRLIDLTAKTAAQQPIVRNRKRSFTLPESDGLSEQDLDGKIEEIKKKINVEHEEKKRERKDSQSSIILLPPGLNKLTTIQQHPLQQELVSFKGTLACEKEEELSPK